MLTRGLAEIERLGLKMGCLPDTFIGLAGMGDLIVTATSKHSRNNRCGYLIGQGYSLNDEKHKKCYFSYEQRKALVEAVRYVDLVIPEESWNQKRSDMHEYHVDTFVMGDDWKGKFDFLKEEGVEVVYLPRTPEISSSQIKKDLYDANAVDGESKTSHEDINTDSEVN